MIRHRDSIRAIPPITAPTALVLLLLLGACATPEQRAEDMAAYINANYGLVCEKLGYAPGSDAHRHCMVSMYNTDQMRPVPGWYGGWGVGVRRW